MLNTLAVAPPSAVELADAFVSEADASGVRSLAGFGLGTVVRVRERICGDGPAGVSKAASGYLAGFAVPDRPGHFRGTAMTSSGKQNSTVQHNTIQTALFNPVTRGGVGPHPVREQKPA